MVARILLFFLLFFSYSALQAQFEYLVPEDRQIIEITEGELHDFSIKGTVTSLSDRAITLRWRRTEIYLDNGWESAVCDPNLCHFPVVSTADFMLEPGELGSMDAHAYSNGELGDSAIVRVCVHQLGDSLGTVQCHTYHFVSDALSSSEEVEHSEYRDISVSPNPVLSEFTITDELNSVGRVDIFNLIGGQVASFAHRSGQYHQIGHLAPGVYLARFYDAASGRVLSTKRLQKQ